MENEVRSRNEKDPEFLETAETVFDESIVSYNSGIDQLSNYLCENILSKIKHNAKEYKRDKYDILGLQYFMNIKIINYISRWHIMNSIRDENKYSITDSGWIMYESFSENLNSLSKKLPMSLFNKCWPALVYKLSMVSL